MEQQLPEYVIARALAQALRTVPGVADVYGGHLGEIATYGRGSRVLGVRVWTEAAQLRVEAHVVAAYAPDLVVPVLAEVIRSRLRRQLQELGVTAIGAIDVAVDDLRLDETSLTTGGT
jgi:uncharacterized alkaline shock family protein YloU